jgi:hypothetical protein
MASGFAVIVKRKISAMKKAAFLAFKAKFEQKRT